MPEETVGLLCGAVLVAGVRKKQRAFCVVVLAAVVTIKAKISVHVGFVSGCPGGCRKKQSFLSLCWWEL